jgi:Uma2 family endonuclease
MVSLLTKPEFQRRAMPISVKAWHGMIAQGLAPKRGELIRGVILEKMSKSILHAKLVSRLMRLLQAALGDSCWVRQEAPLTLDDSEPEPDASVVTGREEDYAAHPRTAALVVEVSVTTLAEDREMVSLYAEAGVSEFWIVNTRDRCIEVYRRPSASTYTVMERIGLGETLRCASLPDVVLEIDALFRDLPTEEQVLKIS